MLGQCETTTSPQEFRTRMNLKYRFDEWRQDLKQCLLLDGDAVHDTKPVKNGRRS